MLPWTLSGLLVFTAAVVFLVGRPPSPPPQPIEFNHKVHIDYFQDGSHRETMVAMHVDILGAAVPQVDEGLCTLCHIDFEQAALTIPRIAYCAECHGAFDGRDWEDRADQRPCMGCHAGAVDSPQASIPNTNTCAACHLPPLQSDLEDTSLTEFIEAESEIPWARVYDYLPGEIVFSHERHAELGRVRCQECHGPVESAEEPLYLDIKFRMEDCMACHETTGASNDCLSCHK